MTAEDNKRLKKLISDKNSCFVAYRLPNSMDLNIIVQKNPEAKVITKDFNYFDHSGFIIKGFGDDIAAPDVFIQPDEIFRLRLTSENNIKYNDVTEYLLNKKNEQTEHERLVSEAINTIKSGDLQKIVISRKVSVPQPASFDLSEFFLNLCGNYNNTFCYLFNLPGFGLWTGATPEILLEVDQHNVSTTSLAGTIKVDDPSYAWRSKEREEQSFVSNHIEALLASHGISSFEKTSSERQMGNIAHLQTTYSFSKESINSGLDKFVDDLQPTPAVSGTPKEKAIAYIKSNEGYDRAYYTGYLGPVNLNDCTVINVNLRCLNVTKDELNVFCGGGITEESDPFEEWKETCLKANTLLKLV